MSDRPADSERGSKGSSTRRRWLRRLLALAIGCALVLGAELAWRSTRSGAFGPTSNPYYVEHDSELGWRYRAGARARHTTGEFDVLVEIDDEGFRSLPHEDRTAADPILVLGDSYAFGWGVEAHEVFTVELERSLGRRVQNRGVSGYGTDQELLLLQRMLAAGSVPSLVTVVVCENDVVEVLGDRAYGRGKPFFDWKSEGRFVPTNLPLGEPWLVKHSHLLRSLLKSFRRDGDGGALPNVVRGRRTVIALLRRMHDRLAERGVTLVVAAASSPWLVEPMARNAIPFCDLGATLAGAAAEGPVHYELDGHWNPHGHRVVARALAGFLTELENGGPPGQLDAVRAPTR